MSQLVVIVCPAWCGVERLTGLAQEFARDESAVFECFEDQIQLVATAREWTITVEESKAPHAVEHEYATNDDLDTAFRDAVRGARFFYLRFNDINPARRFLRGIAKVSATQAQTVWFDTDYGWGLDAREFLDRTDADAHWDWRTPERPGVIGRGSPSSEG